MAQLGLLDAYVYAFLLVFRASKRRRALAEKANLPLCSTTVEAGGLRATIGLPTSLSVCRIAVIGNGKVWISQME